MRACVPLPSSQRAHGTRKGRGRVRGPVPGNQRGPVVTTGPFLDARSSERCAFALEAPAGFEPAVKVLQTSALPLGHGAGCRVVLVPRVRFELTRPKGHCPLKTACLPFHHLGPEHQWYGSPRPSGKPPEGWPKREVWQGRQDSNPRPVDLEATALPAELHPCANPYPSKSGPRRNPRGVLSPRGQLDARAPLTLGACAGVPGPALLQ